MEIGLMPIPREDDRQRERQELIDLIVDSIQKSTLVQHSNDVLDEVRALAEDVSTVKGSVIFLENAHRTFTTENERTFARLGNIEAEINRIGRGEYCIMGRDVERHEIELRRIDDRMTHALERHEDKSETRLWREADKREDHDIRLLDRSDKHYERTIDTTAKISNLAGRVSGFVKSAAIIIAFLALILTCIKVVFGVP